jgi:hypothetical protein
MQQQTLRKVRKKQIPVPNMDAESDVDQIIAHLLESGTTMIGNSYFFIRAQGNNASIYRTNLGYGRIYSSEVIDHPSCGISDDDIEHALRDPAPECEIQGFYPLTEHIEKKLRILFD